ncbi:MAG: DUF4038 domain-containing protein [Clostridia bacterium]|nr:DUF4038 domain-containing protein [Clostridia bacterium]
MKKGWICLLILLMLVVSCAPGAQTGEATGTPASTPTDTVAADVPTDEAPLTPTENTTEEPTEDFTEEATGQTTQSAAPTPKSTASSTPKPTATVQPGGNLLPEASSNFNTVSKLQNTAWTEKYGSSVSVSIDSGGYDHTKCLKFTKPATSAASYYTAAINLIPFIQTAGIYQITFRYKVDAQQSGKPFSGIIRTDTEYSFSPKQKNGQYYNPLNAASDVAPGQWGLYETFLLVEEADIAKATAKNAKWNLGVHQIREDVSAVYIDDVTLVLQDATEEVLSPKVQTWVADEIVLFSSKSYADPLFDVEADLVLTKGSETYTVPFFWDGGKTWRARFVCTSAGGWTYKTVCSDTSDKGLHNRTGTIQCTNYTGSLDIYKHGFVKTVSNTKYFVYADGTPFFYLGDTHWAFSGEPLDMVREAVQTRKSQGFTVIQSEPIDAAFNVTDGVTKADLSGFRENDKRFAVVAENGLLHVNACFFYPDKMSELIDHYGGFSKVSLGTTPHVLTPVKLYDLSDSAKTALKKLARFWVAHYAAYPVMWSLGQEVDDDFFWERSSFNTHEKWGKLNNPYRLLASYIGQCDPYHHPLTAHQESNLNAADSAFRDIAAHTWYAVQWKPTSYSVGISYTLPQGYYASNGQGKPTVLYEGKYCYQDTKDFGARLQGWMAFLNGMYGYGWGGNGTWRYGKTYGTDADSSDGVDTVTKAQKQSAAWKDSLAYPSARQAGYMRTFFEESVDDWYNLIPRFGSSTYMTGNTKLFMLASNAAHTKIVVYFYNFSDPSLAEKPNSTAADAVKTGTLKNLTPGAQYHYQWFNPVTGKTTAQSTFTASTSGTWTIPTKTGGDMVLYVYK